MMKLLSVTHDIKSVIWQTTFLQNEGQFIIYGDDRVG